MLLVTGKLKNKSWKFVNPRHVIVAALLAAFASVAVAQDCPVSFDPLIEIYPLNPQTYPLTSDRYAVQYRVDKHSRDGDWTNSRVYISDYGGTNASPYLKFSKYPEGITSMSFTSIPASSQSVVTLRVTKLWGAPFPEIDHVSVRPRVKGIHVDWVNGFTVQLSTSTDELFAGEQFILWWDGDAPESSAIQGLALFLDPPYARPVGAKVKIVTSSADLKGDLSTFDTLDFEGTVALGSTGAVAYRVPSNIDSVFLAAGSWVQGKLRFDQSGFGHVRRLYGPGVLDVSRFDYSLRQCRHSDIYSHDQGFPSISWVPLPPPTPGNPSLPDRFILDGIVTSDGNYYATDLIINGSVDNVKIMSWNGNNDGFEFGASTSVSNVFVRAGDDSLKMWDSGITVTNATVWQNYNGGVVNLGWSNKNPGDNGLIDGLYVVRTDWQNPTDPSWTLADPTKALSHQNNAVIASLMVPGTNFGSSKPSLYRNIYVEDPPQVLFSLKILPPDCQLHGLASCPAVDLTTPSVLNLHLEHVFTPASIVPNSIGFETLLPGYTTPHGSQTFPDGYILTGSMNVDLTDVLVRLPDGRVRTLTNANAAVVGKLVTNGDHVYVDIQRRRDWEGH